MRPPLPATLPLNSCMSSKNLGSFVVMVNDSHVESATEESKATGLPSAGRFAAKVCHRAHAP